MLPCREVYSAYCLLLRQEYKWCFPSTFLERTRPVDLAMPRRTPTRDPYSSYPYFPGVVSSSSKPVPTRNCTSLRKLFTEAYDAYEVWDALLFLAKAVPAKFSKEAFLRI